MGLIGITNILEYYRFLVESPEELAKLAKDMLIGVTSFFHDQDAFEELRTKVIAPLVLLKRNDELILRPCADDLERMDRLTEIAARTL